MVRGRPKNIALAETRGLVNQREYRARKAAHLATLERENEQLKIECQRLSAELRAYKDGQPPIADARHGSIVDVKETAMYLDMAMRTLQRVLDPDRIANQQYRQCHLHDRSKAATSVNSMPNEGISLSEIDSASLNSLDAAVTMSPRLQPKKAGFSASDDDLLRIASTPLDNTKCCLGLVECAEDRYV